MKSHTILKLKIFLVLILDFFCGSGSAQTISPPGSYKIVNHWNFVLVPFELHNNLIVIKIRINESDTLNFILDSGTSTNIITDPRVSSAMKLHQDQKIEVRGYGNGNAMPAWISTNNKIYLPGIVATGQNLLTIQEDVMDISSYAGLPIHGLLGSDLFNHFVIKINYKDNQLTFYDPKHFKLKKRDGEVIKITLLKGKSHLNAVINLDGQQIPVNLLLDTGAGGSLILDKNFRVPIKSKYKLLGNGLNGNIWGYDARIQNLSIGKFNLKNVIASFPDSANVRSEKGNASGNLGAEIFKRFQPIFNYNEGYLVLKPNKKAFNAPFESDLSGMTVRAQGTGFNLFQVHSVDPGSPAFEAGIQEQDVLYILNGRNAFNLKLNDINNILNFREGKRIKLIVKRGNEMHKLEFRLRRSI